MANVDPRLPAAERHWGSAEAGWFREFGAGIAADRQLRWMRPVLLKTLSLSETA
jgi:hypothetical protein